MQISQVLRHKRRDVVTVPPDATVTELLDLLSQHHVGALVVSPDGSAVSGIVSERDVVRRLAADGTDLLGRRVADIMTTEVRTCRPDDTVEGLMVLMTEQRFRHVPVVQDDRLVGIVSIGDVVKQRLDELLSERDQLTAYINS
jgi:CBS domain-containing protein